MNDLNREHIESQEKLKNKNNPWGQKTNDIDVRGFSGHFKQFLKDWATPMWLIAVIDFICLLFGPMMRVDFSVSTVNMSASRSFTFLTAMFMHANFSHYFFNMIMLLIIAAILDSIPISRYLTLLIFFVSGILGNIGAFIILKIEHTNMLVMGSSGGLASLVGLTIAIIGLMLLYGQRKVRIDADHIYSLFGWKLMTAVIFACSLFDSNLVQSSPIAACIHLIGFIIGIIIGVIMFYVYDSENDNR